MAYLKTPDKFTRLGGKLPKGVLLTGPPGESSASGGWRAPAPACCRAVFYLPCPCPAAPHSPSLLSRCTCPIPTTGTGKTLLARAVAGEAGVPFFYK